jgi:type IV pilus assembly protein PilK
MNNLASQRHQTINSDQFAMLMNHSLIYAGIKIESPQFVIETKIRERMLEVGAVDLCDYMAIFDEGINARAEWLALIDLLTVKETRFFRQPEAFQGLA